MKKVILKLTGELIQHTEAGLDIRLLEGVARQVKELAPTIQFGIVMGGGNFYRGAQERTKIREAVGHYVGMLATMMNGLIIQEVFESTGISTKLFSSLSAPDIAAAPSAQTIRDALQNKKCLIFSGGTGTPYFTTDTTAVVRALQIDADEVWKGTKVDGIYSQDPMKEPTAKFIQDTTYTEAIKQRLMVMDLAAFTLAEQYKVRTRIFNIFSENALIQAALHREFGSTLTT